MAADSQSPPTDPLAELEREYGISSPRPAQDRVDLGNRVDDKIASGLMGATCFDSLRVTPASGTELSRVIRRGMGRLTINNGTGAHAIAVLVNDLDGSVHRAIFIQNNQIGVFSRIRRGDYRLQFQMGSDWTGTRFCRIIGTHQFQEPLNFAEIDDYDRIHYKTYRVTLHRVAGGSAKTTSLPDTAFQLGVQ